MGSRTRQPATHTSLPDNVVVFDPRRRRGVGAIAQTKRIEQFEEPDDEECQFFRLDQAMVLLIHMQAEGVDQRLQTRWRSAIQAALASNPFSPVVASIPGIIAIESQVDHVQRLIAIADYCNHWLDRH